MKLARTGISSAFGALSIMISAVALMPGRSAVSSFFSVARAGNVFSVSPIPRKLIAAIGLIQSRSADEFSFRNRIDANTDLLPELQLAAIHFFEFQVDAHLGEIRNLGDRGAGPGAVAFFESGRRRAERTLRTEVGEDVDDPVLGRDQHHLGRYPLARSTSRTVLSFRCCRRSRSAFWVVSERRARYSPASVRPREIPTSSRLFAPSICETTSALLASSLARSRLYWAVIRFMASCSSTMRWEALV